MNRQEFITVTPDARSGMPCIAGTRFTVSSVLEYLAGGMSETQILADFPELKSEHIKAVLAYPLSGPAAGDAAPARTP